jgi:AbrB family looped-hinge helix DNA binding protein
MSLVRVTTKGQVTIPTRLRERVGLSIGDVLEARIERGKITLTPQSLLDRDIAESLEDIKQGRVYGPFDTAEEMIAPLHRSSKRSRKTNRKAKHI